MGLRHREEEERLSPDTARAFLQVHAEREMRAAEPAPDAPTLADLAESLHIPVEEAEEILREARERVARQGIVETPKWGFMAWSSLATIGLLGAIVLMLTGLQTSASTPGIVATQAQIATPATRTEPAPTAVTAPNGVPDGFALEIAYPMGSVTMEGNPARFGTDYRNLSPDRAAAIRRQLVDAVLGTLRDPEFGAALKDVRTFVMRVRVGGGAWTELRVPLPPFTFPLRNDPNAEKALRDAVGTTLDAGWPTIVDAMPR